MAKYQRCDIEERERLCALGKALSSQERLDILGLLSEGDMIIAEIARELGIQVSSAAFHLKILEQAGLVRLEEKSGTRGNQKRCICMADRITIDLMRKNTELLEIFSAEMPVGAFSSCQVTPTCGLYSVDGPIGEQDEEYCFYYPERMKAGMVWTSSGYLVYKFANSVPKNRPARKITVSMEICSEAPGYREDWKSDITLWINGCDCGTWTSPGDFGARRGRLTPPRLRNGMTQYGQLVVWEVTEEGCCINGEKVWNTGIGQLHLADRSYIAVRIGNKPDARYVGGFNLFGKQFGDYEQDIILTVEY